ncbi:uncharacterized protein LOC116853952 [Odontomachus brunneus]|uniref:uncharacterized protein LOC116853952 n=1 Tax=Odontomachus brunneus TaxID=486640 RepID=UPI0013F2A8BA|nr:uncharacterized protein LOC116853952 [Odontomachus brunneus]
MSFNRDARLPILSREDQTRTSCKLDKRESLFVIFPLVCFVLFLPFSIVAIANAGIVIRTPDEQSNVDREVEHVKSAWRALREGRDRRKERARIGNASTTRWSKIVDRMTRDVDRVQKRCLDPWASRCLRKSASDVFRAGMSKSSLEEDSEVARSTIFPKGKASFQSASLNRSRNFDVDPIDWDTMRLHEATKDITTDERSNEDSLSSQRTTKMRPDACTNARNIDVRSVHTIVSSRSERRDATRAALRDVGATRASVRASVDEYLRNCVGELRRKLPDIEEDKAEERPRDVEPSANDIADMLASLNIGSRGLHDDFFLEKRDDAGVDTEESAREDRWNAAQTTFADTIRQDRIVNDDKSVEDSSSELVDARSALKQSSATSCEGDAFIKIGLNVLNKSVPGDKLSQMLQSEYLRKDLLL